MGNTEEKRAARGILVTTSWVSPESKTFAARNNRLMIIEGGGLKHLLAERLDIDVRIELPPKTTEALSQQAGGTQRHRQEPAPARSLL